MRTRCWRWYLVAGVPMTAVYLWLPAESAKLVMWPLIGWSSVIAILVGVFLNRPQSRRAWYLLAAGVATLMIGDNLYSFRGLVLHAETLFPSFVDIVYLAMYPLLVTGLALLVHRRLAGRDRAGLIDTAIITTSVGLVSWVLLIAPYVRLDDISLSVRLTSIAYPVGDIALLATAVRLAVGRGRRPIAFWLLAGSLLPLLVADGMYGFLNLTGNWNEQNPVDIGWAAFYIGWGAAALHPSMPVLSLPSATTRRITSGRLVIVGSAVLVPPVVLFIQDRQGHVADATAVAVTSAILFVLVLVRIAGLVRNAADEKSEARFHALVEKASDAIVVLDEQGRVRYRTPSTERVLGRTGAELEGRILSELLEAGDRERLQVMLSNVSATASVEWRLRRGDGQWRDLEVVPTDMRDMADVGGLVLTIRDITERKHLDQELRRQALHDSLTGLANRTLFLDRVDHALTRAGAAGGSVGVLLLDLDDFKVVNDSLGHAAGDDLLGAVATRLTGAMRSTVTVARLGGDEFAMLLESDDLDGAVELAALRVREALAAPFLLRDEEVSVNVSIGMAVGSPSDRTSEDLLRDADLAMYVAKRNGKNRFEQYQPGMHEEASRRLEVAVALRGAIDRNELAVHYQPIVDVADGRTLGAEALVRWQHPERGLLAPSEFVPVAEATGLIIPLERWVLLEACRQTEEWRESGVIGDTFYVSVNLSTRHIEDPDVVTDVRTALDESGLPARALVLEVTETVFIQDLDPAGSTLATLKALGLRIAVDDFGTGYSSLAHLSNFPIDIIKIDKSFVDRVATTVEGETMVRAVVEFARTLGLTAIAEGVESTEQAAALQKLDCRLAQGFLFARPMPGGELTTKLERQSRHLV